MIFFISLLALSFNHVCAMDKINKPLYGYKEKKEFANTCGARKKKGLKIPDDNKIPKLLPPLVVGLGITNAALADQQLLPTVVP